MPIDDALEDIPKGECVFEEPQQDPEIKSKIDLELTITQQKIYDLLTLMIDDDNIDDARFDAYKYSIKVPGIKGKLIVKIDRYLGDSGSVGDPKEAIESLTSDFDFVFKSFNGMSIYFNDYITKEGNEQGILVSFDNGVLRSRVYCLDTMKEDWCLNGCPHYQNDCNASDYIAVLEDDLRDRETKSIKR
jgi:hypothetical protein